MGNAIEISGREGGRTGGRLVAGWSFTSMCNLRCMHCYNASGRPSPGELTLDQALSVAGKLSEAGVSAVNFGGGECALRPDFIDLCKRLNDLGMKVSYTTNGTTFRRIEPHLDLFHDVGVSIDFPDPERHDAFRGIPGTFRRAASSLRTLSERGVNNEMVTCLTGLNCPISNLERMYGLARELGADHWRLNRFRANGRGIGNRGSLALTRKELRNAYAFLSRHVDDSVSVPEPLFRSAFGGRYMMGGDPSGFTAFRIQPDGEVSPSVFLSESGGNIKEKSLPEIMDSPVFRRIRDRRPRGKCRQCPSYPHCRGGDAGASFLEHGHFDGPDPLCWLEPGDARPEPVRSAPEKWNVHEMYLCTVYVPVVRA